MKRFLCSLLALVLFNIGWAWAEEPTTEFVESSEQLNTLNDQNIIPIYNIDPVTTNGITYSAVDGVFMFEGTATKNVTVNLYGYGEEHMVDIKPGETYRIRYECDQQVVLQVLVRDAEHPDGYLYADIRRDTVFTVPDEATHVWFRIRINNGRDITPVSVHPIISKFLGNEEQKQITDGSNDLHASTNDVNEFLMKQLDLFNALNIIPTYNIPLKTTNGITYSAVDGVFMFEGTATKNVTVNLYGYDEEHMVDIKPGETYRIRYECDQQVVLQVLVRDAEHPDGYLYADIRHDTVFTVPDEATHVWFRIRINNGRDITPVSVRPIISKFLSNEELEMQINAITHVTSTPMLTIIDDDGDMKFYTDLLPIIKEKNVPIATAVTTKRIGSAPRWMGWDEIMECYENGAEVLCHTYDHIPIARDQEVDLNALIMDYTIAKQIMYAHGLHDADILVYNNASGNNAAVREAAERVFKCAIHSGGSHINYAGNLNPYYLYRFPIDTEPRLYNLDILKDLVDEVCSSGGWMIWIMHTSSSTWTEEARNNLCAAIDYAREKGLPIVTANYGYQNYIGK